MPYKDIRKARKASRLKMSEIRINIKVKQNGVTIDTHYNDSNMLYPDVNPNSYSQFTPLRPTFTAEQKLKYSKWVINV